jgi:hypothetical protein
MFVIHALKMSQVSLRGNSTGVPDLSLASSGDKQGWVSTLVVVFEQGDPSQLGGSFSGCSLIWSVFVFEGLLAGQHLRRDSFSRQGLI